MPSPHRLELIALIFLKRRNIEAYADPGAPRLFFSVRDLADFAVAMVAVTALLSLSSILDFILFYGFYWGITAGGCVLLVAVLVVLVRGGEGAQAARAGA